MLQLTFKQTNSELLVRAAASVLFGTLVRRGAKIVSISDLGERPQYGFTASAATEPVGPKFVRITDLQDGRIDWETVPFCECTEPEKYLLREDDLLFARTGATTGKTHLVREPEHAIFASYLIRLRPKVGVFAGYLHAFFQSDNYWSQISDEKEGSAQPNVNGEKLAALQIPFVESKLQHAIADFLRCVRRRQDGEKIELPQLPAPLTEQQRVVARIEELAAQIHEARTLRHQAAEEAEALIHSLISKLAYQDKWEMKRLRDVVEINPSRIGKVKLKPTDKVSFVPMKAVDDVTGKIAWPEMREFHEVAKGYTWFEDGDVIFARITPCMQNGKAALARNLANRVGFGSTEFHVIRAREELCAEWIYHLVRHKAFRDDAADHFKGTAGQQRVPQSFLEEKLIPVPPLAEQRRIVAELDALQAEVDALKRLQAETAAELDALLPAILDKAFKGEL
jgi:type I restriction enzyme, S subunit